MMAKCGITDTVKTIYSKTKVKDIINYIVNKKTNAIKYFLEGEEFNQTLVFGAYLCGNHVAKSLISDSDEVILVDIYPHLKHIVDERIKFMDFRTFQLNLRNKDIDPDLVIDITGIGGISQSVLSQLNPKVLIVENPKGSYDKDIFEVDDSNNRVNACGEKRGLLNTFRSSKVSKTSGTMTLTLDTIMDSCIEIKELEGVLYSIPNIKYYEGILFHEKDAKRFLTELNSNAIIVSALDEDIVNEIDKIILKNMDRINSFVERIR